MLGSDGAAHHDARGAELDDDLERVVARAGDRAQRRVHDDRQQLSSPTSLPAGAWNEAEYARIGEISREGGMAAVRDELPSSRRTFPFQELSQLLQWVEETSLGTPVATFATDTRLGIVMPPRTPAFRR